MSRRRLFAIAILSLLPILFVLLLATTSMLSSFGGTPGGERLARIQRSPNYREDHFVNLVPTSKLTGSLWDMINEDLFGEQPREPQGEVPVVMRTAADFEQPPRSGLRATWLGHATVLLELGGRRVIFDAMLSDRCSPTTIAGPRRFHPPPIAPSDLPPIDAALVSHDHYDHLDMETIKVLAARGTTFVLPLGIGAHLEEWSIPASQIVELDWHESTEIGGVRLTAVPSRHYSGRGLLTQDPTLWASWVATSSSSRVFFSGDTGYFDELAKTGERYGPFDLTIIKIGAYDPAWAEIHMNPEEAIRAHRDLGGKLMLPIHWATFDLAPHAYREPAERVLAAAKSEGVSIAIPKPGEMVEPASPPPLVEWWAQL